MGARPNAKTRVLVIEAGADHAPNRLFYPYGDQ
jgi:hypothetical protein